MSQQQPTIDERVTELLAKNTELAPGQIAIRLGDCSPSQVSDALTRLHMAGRAVSELRYGVDFWMLADPAGESEPPRLPITVGEMLDYANAECLLDQDISIHPLDAFAQGVATAEKHHGITGGRHETI